MSSDFSLSRTSLCRPSSRKTQTGSRERRGGKYRELYNNFETNKWQELTGRETRCSGKDKKELLSPPKNLDKILKDQGDELSRSRRQQLWSEARLRVGPEEEMKMKIEWKKTEKLKRNLCSDLRVHEENRNGWRRTKGRNGHGKCLLVSGLIYKCVQSIMGHKVEQWVWVQVQTETGTPAEYRASKLSQHSSIHSWSLCTQGPSTGDRGVGVKRLFRYGLTMKKIKLARHTVWWMSAYGSTISVRLSHRKLLTFVLRLRAGDDPLDQAAPHQCFSGEARLLPFPRILHPARRGLHTVGVSQQAVDHLAIRLEGKVRPVLKWSRRLWECKEGDD